MTITSQITIKDNTITLPGLATVHSHAFQRALRGRTQRRTTTAGSFWSWRGLMYQLAAQLDPEDIFQISRFAYIELALSGVTAVGEFHYLHHQPNGTPYPNRTELAEAVIQAAKEAGLRISLIRTAYQRAGFQQTSSPAQNRFIDTQTENVLDDVETLRQKYAGDPLVRITTAAHSIRAVPLASITTLNNYTKKHHLPFHMHVSEQPRELQEAIAEYGTTPVQLLANAGILSPRFVAVHATHLNPAEITALGHAQAYVCLCRTTERDLGDGLPHTTDLIKAGTKLCVGVDSHASPDPFEEIRAIELDERSRTQKRTVAAEAPYLLQAGTQFGYEALDMSEQWLKDKVELNLEDPSLAGLAENQAIDGVVFAATPRAVTSVWVNGRQIIQDGRHPAYPQALQGYRQTLKKHNLL